MVRIFAGLTAFFLYFSTAAMAADDFANLKVQVEGVKNRTGEVGIALYQNKKGFPTHLEHAYEPAWIALKDLSIDASAVEHTFEGLAAGEWAVSVVHDDNGNRKIDRSTLGFPKEGVGFSNDQKVVMSAPDFDDCKFSLAEGETKAIVIKLDYRD